MTVCYRNYHGLNILIQAVFGRKGLCVFEQCSFLPVEFLISVEYSLLFLFAKAGPIQAALVDVADFRRIMPANGQKGRDIPRDSRQPGDKALFTDGDKLVRSG